MNFENDQDSSEPKQKIGITEQWVSEIDDAAAAAAAAGHSETHAPSSAFFAAAATSDRNSKQQEEEPNSSEFGASAQEEPENDPLPSSTAAATKTTTTTQQFADKNCRNSCEESGLLPVTELSPTTTGVTTTTTITIALEQEEHYKAALARERSVIEKLQHSNEQLRKEIEQRDVLEDQMEQEINRLTEELLEAKAKFEKEIAAGKAMLESAVKQKEKALKNLEKAKERNIIIKKDIRQRKRAFFEGGESGGEQVEEEDAKKKAKKPSRLVSENWNGKECKHDLKWLSMFEELKAFKAEYGHCDVPAKWKGSDPRWSKLSCWVSTQRTQHKLLRAGKWTNLKPERAKQLQAMGFKWNAQPETVTLTFEERIDQLLEYKALYGDANVPQKYPSAPGLGNFVLQQRKHYRTGVLAPDRIEKLEAVGFQWSLRNRGGPLEERIIKARCSNNSTAKRNDHLAEDQDLSGADTACDDEEEE